MKTLYEFTIYKEEDVKKIEESKDEKGNLVKTEKIVKEKKPHNFFIKKPNRSIIDEAELFFGVCLSEGVKAGLLTASQLYKRFMNDGGILSEPDKQKLQESIERLGLLQMEFQKLSILSEKTENDEKRLTEIFGEIGLIRSELQKFELQQSALFDHTAETRARNQTILWYVLNLSYKKEEDGKDIPLFGEGTYKEKLKKYDEMEENGDEFERALIKKIFFVISFWFTGRATTKEEFQEVDKISETIEE